MNKDIETMHYNISTLMNQNNGEHKDRKQNSRGERSRPKGTGGPRTHKKFKK